MKFLNELKECDFEWSQLTPILKLIDDLPQYGITKGTGKEW